MTSCASTLMPDWVSPPGDSIADRIEELGWSQRELADRLDYTQKHISQLINGKAPISEETAFRLEKVIGSTARFWLEREAQYQEALERSKQMNILAKQNDWLKALPLRDMIKFGWVKEKTHKGFQVAECLKFFGVASVEAWSRLYANPGAAFRASEAFDRDGPAVGAWLRMGEILAESESTSCSPFDLTAFKGSLNELRTLTLESDPSKFVPHIQSQLKKVGVIVVFTPAPKGCPISGAARWITKDKALVQLSLRHKSNDHLWFSFFHEAAHIVLHGKNDRFIDIERSGIEGLDESKEEEANSYARDILISPTAFSRLRELTPSAAEVNRFSREIGIAPGIVVGRMQKEGLIPWSHLNGLKIKYEWSS